MLEMNVQSNRMFIFDISANRMDNIHHNKVINSREHFLEEYRTNCVLRAENTRIYSVRRLYVFITAISLISRSRMKQVLQREINTLNRWRR